MRHIATVTVSLIVEDYDSSMDSLIESDIDNAIRTAFDYGAMESGCVEALNADLISVRHTDEEE